MDWKVCLWVKTCHLVSWPVEWLCGNWTLSWGRGGGGAGEMPAVAGLFFGASTFLQRQSSKLLWGFWGQGCLATSILGTWSRKRVGWSFQSTSRPPSLCLFTSLGTLTRVLSVAWYLECGALSVQSQVREGRCLDTVGWGADDALCKLCTSSLATAPIQVLSPFPSSSPGFTAFYCRASGVYFTGSHHIGNSILWPLC